MRRHVFWIVIVALAAHGWGLRNGFVYDDRRFIVENDALESARLHDFLLDPSTQTADGDRDVYRPLRALGHAFDRRRWDLEPFGFHLHSLVAHVLVALLALWALTRLLPETGPGPPLWGALALACHPLGVEVVDWVTSRGDLYAAGFGLAALALAVDGPAGRPPGRHRAESTVAGLCAALAVLGKESALVLPLVAGWHHLTLRRGNRGGILALSLGVGAAVILRHLVLQGTSPIQTAPHGGDALAQAGWALHGAGVTLGHLVWPTGLMVEYPQELWMGTVPPWLRFPAWIALAWVAATWLLRRSRPGLAFTLGWMLLAYLPSSSLIVTLRNLVNDRAAYPLLPAFGAALLLAAPASWRRGPARAVLITALVLLWTLLSIARVPVFHDEAALWNDVVAKEPRSVKAQMGLAWVAGPGDPERQRRHLLRAAENAPPTSRLHGIALAELGDLILRQDADPGRAEPFLANALHTLRATREKPGPSPEELATLTSLATARWALGRDADALALLDAARRESPGQVMLPIVEASLWIARARAGEDPDAWHRARAALAQAATLDAGHPMVRALSQVLDAAPR